MLSRQEIITEISKILAITKFDIEHRQALNDFSLNNYSENFYRDILNYIHSYKLENANYAERNTAHIDLIDKKNKLFYQITSTRSKEKIEHTLKILQDPKYKKFTLKILYLLDKAKPQQNTIDEFNSIYNIDLKKCLLDCSDLMREINNLEEVKLKELYEKYFKTIKERYTDNIVLNLVCEYLIRNNAKVKKQFDDNFGSIETTLKFKKNNFNNRICSEINKGLDFRVLFFELESDNKMEELRLYIINDLYKIIIYDELSSKIKKEIYYDKSIEELHALSVQQNLDFNKIIQKLYDRIDDEIKINDFNSMNIIWSIIAYFFEICDVGVK